MKPAALTLFVFAVFLATRCQAQERPYFVTYSHEMEEPGNQPVSPRRTMIRSAAIALLLVLFPAAFVFGAADGSWLKNVPARDHDKTSPYRDQSDAIAAGRRIFVDRCSHCHGENAEGTKKRPPLKSERVQQQATEGDLLLVNGNMRKGMPSWAKLPDQQLWQVIAYLKSLHE